MRKGESREIRGRPYCFGYQQTHSCSGSGSRSNGEQVAHLGLELARRRGRNALPMRNDVRGGLSLDGGVGGLVACQGLSQGAVIGLQLPIVCHQLGNAGLELVDVGALPLSGELGALSVLY